jgi:hypothetical protein
MNKLRSSFLYVLSSFVIFPLCLLGASVAAKGKGIRRLRVGKLRVWGDEGFLKLCSSSIDRIQTLDPNLHQALTQRRRAWVFQDAQGPGGDAPPLVFLVNKSYVVWQSDGIVARLVYIAFCVSTFSTRQIWHDNFWNLHRKVMENSRSWLETRGFPRELADCYVDDQNKQEASHPPATTLDTPPAQPLLPPSAET